VAIGIRNGTQIASAASATVALPAPAVAGSLLLACCVSEAAGAATVPTGFTSLGSGSSSGGTARAIQLCYKIAVGGEQSITFGGSPTTPASVIVEYTGVSTAVPVGTAATNAAGTSQSTPATGTVLAGCSGAVISFFGARSTSATWSAEATSGTNAGSTTERADANGLAVADALVSTVSGNYTGTATVNSSLTAMVGIAVIKDAVQSKALTDTGLNMATADSINATKISPQTYNRTLADVGIGPVGAPIMDTFLRADQGPPPSADWTTDPWGYGAVGFRVVSNRMAPT
jgi:hypothetical protein